MWFLNGNGTRLVQIQRDRFAFNRRKTDADEKYPRYNQVRSDFSQNLEVFTQFLEEEGFEGLQPNQVDLTYVNLIPGGDKQHGYSPLENHLRLWAGVPSGSCLPKPESTSLKTQFAFRDGDEFLGRLHVHLEPRFLTIDESPVYELQLTARGAPADQGMHGIPAFLDRAHVWIVQTFASLTTKEIHQEWKRRQ